jgi:extracellular elastinolytic metalloproteinase
VDSTHVYEYVINAASGRVLFRNNIVESDSGEGTRWLYNPSPIFGPSSGLVDGHTQSLVTYPDSWGPINTNELSGNNAHVYSDVNDNNVADSSEKVPATGHEVEGQPEFNYPFSSNTSDFFDNCSTNFPCSWERLDVGDNSWTTNRKQNAAQVFWFVNNYHDHLEQSPIGFTPAAGNFQVNNNGQGGLGNDPLHAENDDGANTDGSGGPDDNHIDNANMATEQDGVPPRMQMYLFDNNNFVDANGGDEADVVYHEYTHGLSHRLITDAQGFPRLDGEEANAMGEGWSDWYAMDYLVSQKLDTDTSTTGDVFLGYYVSGGQHLIRSMSMDCPVGPPANSDCQSSFTSHQGGYTLSDYGQVSGNGPEVHADGEIWGQTLWQIRQAFQTTGGTCAGLCSTKAEDLVTRAMELGPPNPSMLNERDAILLADQTDFGGPT